MRIAAPSFFRFFHLAWASVLLLSGAAPGPSFQRAWAAEPPSCDSVALDEDALNELHEATYPRLFLDGLGAPARLQWTPLAGMPAGRENYYEAALPGGGRALGLELAGQIYPVATQRDGEVVRLTPTKPRSARGEALDRAWTRIWFKITAANGPPHQMAVRDVEIPADFVGLTRPSALPAFPGVLKPGLEYTGYVLAAVKGEIARRPPPPDGRILVLGTGAGEEAAYLARETGLSVDATDINPMAIANTRASAARTGVSDQVSAWVSDLFDRVNGEYDLVVFTAPFAVAVESGCGMRADPDLDDPDGKLLRRLLATVRRHLAPTGRLVLLSLRDLDEPARFREFYGGDELRIRGIFNFQDGMSSVFGVHEICRKNKKSG